MKIGIFGGSFNPPHKAHKKIAEDLIKYGFVDKVIFVPVGDYYKKQDLILFKYRFEMIKLMIDNPNITCSNIGADERFKYTYQLLDYFNNNQDEIYFICGLDNLKELDTWKKYKYILEKYKLLVIRRNNDNVDKILKKYNDYLDRIIISNMEEEMISSSLIRKNIDNDNFLRENLDIKVYKYIKNNFQLYH